MSKTVKTITRDNVDELPADVLADVSAGDLEMIRSGKAEGKLLKIAINGGHPTAAPTLAYVLNEIQEALREVDADNVNGHGRVMQAIQDWYGAETPMLNPEAFRRFGTSLVEVFAALSACKAGACQCENCKAKAAQRRRMAN